MPTTLTSRWARNFAATAAVALLPIGQMALKPIEDRWRAKLTKDEASILDLVEAEDLELATELMTPFAHWIKGDGKVEPLINDKDVFGDGTVLILNTPGHTPGHHSLLVKLNNRAFLISGDLVHFRENYVTNGVPWFNASRADTLASIDRFKQLSSNVKAEVIIQHDARDISKLPAFPAAAK